MVLKVDQVCVQSELKEVVFLRLPKGCDRFGNIFNSRRVSMDYSLTYGTCPSDGMA